MRVIKIYFKNLTLVLCEDFVSLAKIFQLLFHLATFGIAQPFELAVGHRLRHCPAVEVVRIDLHDERGLFSRII